MTAGNGPFQQPSADGINIWSAAIADDRHADRMFGRETDPRAAIVSATILFQDATDKLVPI